MNKKNIKPGLAISLFLLLVLSSCTDEIQYMKGEETYSRLIVEGYVSTDTIRQKVILSKSMGLFDEDTIPFISNAKVSISDGTQVFNLSEDKKKKGTYLSDQVFAGIPGKTYSLSIINVDVNNDGVKENYTASSILNPVNKIDSITVKYEKSNPHQKGWLINLYAQDPGGRNFYLIKVLRNDTLVTDSVFKYSSTENVGFEGKYYDGFPVYYLQEERKDEKLKPGDKVTVEMYAITEGYYRFIQDFISEYIPKVPIFSGPSANVSTNIVPKNQALGYFSAYSIARKSTVYR